MCRNRTLEIKMAALGLALYFEAIEAVLREFKDENKEDERFKARLLAGAKFLVDAGSDLEKSFKPQSGRRTFGFNREHPSEIDYYTLSIFLRAVRQLDYQANLVEIRQKIFSIINHYLPLVRRRKNAEDCIVFFSRIKETCMFTSADDIPLVSPGIKSLLLPSKERPKGK